MLVLRVPYLDLVARLWLVALGTIAIATLARRGLRAWPITPEPRLRVQWRWWRRPRPERIRPLEELEHAVAFSLGTAFDVHYRLRPHLVRIASHRLERRGVSLAAQPDRARTLLGPELWELVRSDRPEPEDRNAPGLAPLEIRRVVEALDGV